MLSVFLYCPDGFGEAGWNVFPMNEWSRPEKLTTKCMLYDDFASIILDAESALKVKNIWPVIS